MGWGLSVSLTKFDGLELVLKLNPTVPSFVGNINYIVGKMREDEVFLNHGEI